jgi:hypothetical protein
MAGPQIPNISLLKELSPVKRTVTYKHLAPDGAKPGESFDLTRAGDRNVDSTQPPHLSCLRLLDPPGAFQQLHARIH